MSGCASVRDLLIPFCKRRLAGDSRTLVREHLRGCADCRTELGEVRDLLARFRSCPVLEPSHGSRERLWQRLESLRGEAGLPALRSPLLADPGWRGRLAFARAYVAWRFRNAPVLACSLVLHVIFLAGLTFVLLRGRRPLEPERTVQLIVPGSGEEHRALGSAEPRPWRTPRRPDLGARSRRARQRLPLEVPERVAAWFSRRSDPEAALRRAGRSSDIGPIRRGLSWLAGIQEPDGSWSPERLGGAAGFRVGGSGMALLAFLGQGVSSGGTRPHAGAVARGIEWLLGQQRRDGCFGPKGSLYQHALATMAVAEDAILSRRDHRRALAAAAGHIVGAQLPAGGWAQAADPRRRPHEPTSSWAAIALAVSSMSGVRVEARSFDQAVRWLTRQVDDRSGRSAAAALAIVFQAPGLRPSGPVVRLPCFPIPSSDLQKADPSLWCNLAGALRLATDPRHGVFASALSKALVPLQEVGGSWPLLGNAGEVGGRVQSTALAILCLQSDFRYAPLPRKE